MECEKCKRQFVRPLELYNGDWACPRCHNSLALNSIQLNVTDDNENMFKMAEICYLRALKLQSNKKVYDKFLSKAMAYCKDAARSGHPKALVRLGYFYEFGYFSIDLCEAFKQAYECYRSVWNGKIDDARTIQSDAEYLNGGNRVKKSAARLYLNLLNNAPSKMRAHPRYRYESELENVKREGLYDGDVQFNEAYSDENRTSRIFEILQSCYSKERAPLFGLIMLNSEEFYSLCAATEKTKNGTKKKILKIAEKVSIRLINIADGNTRAIKNQTDISGVPDGNYCLYFFNTNGKHFMSQGKMNAVKRALEKGDSVVDCVKLHELISAICEGSDSDDYVFSDDDILVHKSRAERVGHALGDMIKTFKNNLKRGEN